MFICRKNWPILVFCLGFVSNSFGAFSLTSQQVIRGRARITGTAKIIMTAEIKPVNNVFDEWTYTTIEWPLVNLNSTPAPKWKIADHLIVLRTTFTAFNAGVQIVTDNTAESADPKFFDPSALPTENPPAAGTREYISYVNNPDSNPAGLVLDMRDNSKYTLPVAWTVKSNPKEVNSSETNGLLPSDPNTGETTGNGYRFQWIFLSDKKTPAIDWNLNLQLGDTETSLNIDNNNDGDTLDIIDTPEFVDGNDNSTVLDAGRGLHVAQGNSFNGAGAGSRVSFIYLQANFENAFSPVDETKPPLEYKTSRLLIEAFTE